MKKWIFILLAIVTTHAGMAQDFSRYQKNWYASGTDSMPYRLLLPANYDAGKQYPLVLFLHGSGERGNDNEKQLIHGGKLFLQDHVQKKFPAIVLFPQCSNESFWSNVDIESREGSDKREFTFKADGEPTKALMLLQELMDQILQDYPVDRAQVYVGGLSMGGMGTFEIVRRNPKMFAAAFPICGGTDLSSVHTMTQPAWWIFHGAKDDVVPPQLSELVAAELENAGANVKLTIYPNANHNSWDAAFAEPDLLPWLFSNKRSK